LVRLVPVVLVGQSRVLLAVHWPSDVVAAIALGVAWRRLLDGGWVVGAEAYAGA
jgi:membrane-associated phospholipid phosphatase